MEKWILLVVLFFICANGDVIVLTDENIEEKTTSGVWFVEFYAPWCGHCKQLEPIWTQLAVDLKGTSINVAKIDATTQIKSAERFGVKGYPTLKVFADNTVFEFSDTRTPEKMKEFALGGFRKIDGLARPPAPESLPSKVIVLNDTSFESFVGNSENEEKWLVEFYAPWCGACQAFIPTYEELGAKFAEHKTIRIAKVDATANNKLKERFGLTGYPTIFLFNSGRYYTYNGERTLSKILEFLEGGYKTMRSYPMPSKDQLNEDPIDLESDVVVLHDADFEDKVKMGFEKDWFVEFYATWCGHCKQLKPVWEILATTLKAETKKVLVAKIEANGNLKTSQRFGVSGFPTLVLIHEGQYYDYSGGRTLSALKEFAMGGWRNATPAPIQFESEKPTLVKHLDDNNLEHITQAATGATTGDWLVNFHASWCKSCLLWRPIIEYTAQSLRHQMSVAEIDCADNPESLVRFGITHYPTFILLSHGQMYKYNGTRDLNLLIHFSNKTGKEFKKASAKVERVPPPPTTLERIQIHLGFGLQAAYFLYKHNPFVSLLLIFFGILSGIVFTVIVGKIIINRYSVNTASSNQSRIRNKKKH